MSESQPTNTTAAENGRPFILCPTCATECGRREVKTCSHGTREATCVRCGAVRKPSDPYWGCGGSINDAGAAALRASYLGSRREETKMPNTTIREVSRDEWLATPSLVKCRYIKHIIFEGVIDTKTLGYQTFRIGREQAIDNPDLLGPEFFIERRINDFAGAVSWVEAEAEDHLAVWREFALALLAEREAKAAKLFRSQSTALDTLDADEKGPG